jgi:hypothetical protein
VGEVAIATIARNPKKHHASYEPHLTYLKMLPMKREYPKSYSSSLIPICIENQQSETFFGLQRIIHMHPIWKERDEWIRQSRRGSLPSRTLG